MLRRLFRRLCYILGLAVGIALFFAIKQATSFERDTTVLMNKYYKYRQTHPEVAKQALLIVLKQNPKHLPALMAMSQWRKNSFAQQQSKIVLTANDANPIPNLSDIKQPESSDKAEIPQQEKNQIVAVLEQSSPSLENIQFPIQKNQVITPSPLQKPLRPHLQKFYQLRVAQKQKAFKLIQHWVKGHPSDVIALKEAGYLAAQLNQTTLALEYFTRAYSLTHDAQLALQIAYLYNQNNQNKLAYRYFEWATKNPDSQQALIAENALTRLRGEQTKLLPPPYFGEFFAMPFTQSRFGLTVTQFIGRLGIEQANRWKTREYIFSQITDDNQSRAASLGKISQIYQDDVEITGIGVQMSPITNLPLILYGEMGAAYDLVYRNRNKWRSDFRGGVLYYQEFGQAPAFYDEPTWSLNYYATWYGNITYFSRYNNNVIGLARTHQGVRLFQYKSSMVNVYARGLIVQDTQRLFYNNFAEVGPGVSFVPSNRYNVELQFDYIQGIYLPASGINPYGKNYTNKLLQLFVYFKI